MKCTSPATQSWFATLILGLLISMAPGRAQAQNPVPQNGDSDLTRQQLAGFDRFLDGHPELAQQLRKDPSLVNNEDFLENHADLQRYLQGHPEVREELNQNPNAVMHQEKRYDQREDRDGDRDQDRNRGNGEMTRGEHANMGAFMDSHPEIAEQLRKDPSLVDNKEFVERHPALQEYLANHPEVREEYKENPNGFMRQEQHFDRSEDSAMRRNGDATRGGLASMDRFMDSHPEIGEQLRKDPSLVDNKEFVQHHPALQEYLANHPEVREEYKENPNGSMRQEQRFDRGEDSAMRRNGDVTRGELASMDRFMDSHPEIAEQLRKDPSLVDNKEFVQHHPALQEYLANHPEAREEYKENPNGFMRQEQRFDRNQDSAMRRNGDVNREQVSSFHEFLEGHGKIAGELSKNPSLATNQEYLENHPALHEYLQANPQVHQGLRENPQAFVKSAQQFETTPKTTPKSMADPKLK